MDFHAFIIQGVGATNTKGQRIKITSCRYGQSITIDVNKADNFIWDTAKKHLQGLGYAFPDECTFEMAKFGHFGLVSTTFEPLKP